MRMSPWKGRGSRVLQRQGGKEVIHKSYRIMRAWGTVISESLREVGVRLILGHARAR